MPSDSTRNTLARQWELLKLLPSRRPGKTVSELTTELANFGFSVTKRTVERDLSNLSGVFPIDCNTKGTPYGWFWAEGSTSDLPGITLADALSLQMVEEIVEPLLPASVLAAVKPRFQQAANKLASQKKKPSHRPLGRQGAQHPAGAAVDTAADRHRGAGSRPVRPAG